MSAFVAAALLLVPIADTLRVRVDTIAEIQGAFDARRAALTAKDLTALRELYDPARARSLLCAVEQAKLQFAVGRTPPLYRAIRTVAYRGYVRAYAEVEGEIVREYLRAVPGKWVFSAPTTEEVGDERVLTGENVRLTYWSIDDEIGPQMLEAATYARTYALLSAPAAKDRLLMLRIDPTRESGSSLPCLASAAALLSREPFEIRADGAQLRYVSATFGIGQTSRRTFIHEALHWTQGIAAPLAAAGRADWWLMEGWPTLVASGDGVISREFSRIGCRDLPTYAGLGKGPGLAHDAPEDVVQRYYVYAASAIRYLIENFGGEDTYWRFLKAYELPGSDDEVTQRAVGLKAEVFRDGWADWAAKRYCR